MLPATLHGGGSSCGAGQTCTLSGDITLSGSDALSWNGTAASHCRINSNGFGVTTADWGGVLSIKYCDIYDLGSAGKNALNLSSNNNAAVTIQNSTFNHSSNFYVSAIPTVVIQDNILATKDATYVSQDFGAGLSSFFYENAGSVVTNKVFQRNKILHGGYLYLRGDSWTIDSNVIIGPRAAIGISGGKDNTITKNFIHGMVPVSPNKYLYWADEEAFNLGPTGGAQDLSNVA